MRNDDPITLHSINHTRREKKTCPEAFVYSFWGMDLFLFISFILFSFRVITLFYGYTFLTNSIWIKLVYKHSKWLVIVIGCTHLVGDFRVNRVQGLVGSTSGCVLSGTPRSIQPRNKSITYMNSNSKKKRKSSYLLWINVGFIGASWAPQSIHIKRMLAAAAAHSTIFERFSSFVFALASVESTKILKERNWFINMIETVGNDLEICITTFRVVVTVGESTLAALCHPP